jgi:hypothetical protein
MATRAPPGAPTLASHGLNVRCKKTYRATQRTNRLLFRLGVQHISTGRLYHKKVISK